VNSERPFMELAEILSDEEAKKSRETIERMRKESIGRS